MTKDPHGLIEFENLVSLLQTMRDKTETDEAEDRYMKVVETFLSHMKEDPKTILQKVNEAKTFRKREELRKRTVREAILYLDSLAERDEISMSEYTYRSAVIGIFMRLLADYVIEGK